MTVIGEKTLMSPSRVSKPPDKEIAPGRTLLRLMILSGEISLRKFAVPFRTSPGPVRVNGVAVPGPAPLMKVKEPLVMIAVSALASCEKRNRLKAGKAEKLICACL